MLETLVSGISPLPFGTFVLLVQPIHLAIGIVEGLATAAVVLFVWKSRPEILQPCVSLKAVNGYSIKGVLVGFVAATLITGCTLSWFASAHPDGLEWAMFKTAGVEELAGPEDGVHSSLATIQEKTAFLPGYGFKSGETHSLEEEAQVWPAIDPGTSMSGLVGGLLTLCLTLLIGVVVKHRKAIV